jgi:predicted DNA-binding protein (MmcQ/YjbR family)
VAICSFSPSSELTSSAAIDMADARWLVRYQDPAAEIEKLRKKIKTSRENMPNVTLSKKRRPS